MSHWQPIETCPPNVTRTLLLWPAFRLDDNCDATTEKCGEMVAMGYRAIGGKWDYPPECEAVGAYNDDDYEYGDPTHWMPLPDPPAIDRVSSPSREAQDKNEEGGTSLTADAAVSAVQEDQLPHAERQRFYNLGWEHCKDSCFWLGRMKDQEIRIAALEAIVREIAEWKLCDEEPSKCVGDSGPYCSTHGENDLHAELIHDARFLLGSVPQLSQEPAAATVQERSAKENTPKSALQDVPEPE